VLPPHRLVQVHCCAPSDLLLNRCRGRDRHPGHLDDTNVSEVAAAIDEGRHEPLELEGELIELDTSREVDVGALTERIRRQLERT
jgi:hypothetical protein